MSIIDPVILSQLQLLAKSMAATLAALDTSVTGVKTDVGTVSGKVTTVDTKVGNVSGQVTTVNNAVAALQGTANTINATVSAINNNAATKGPKSVQRFEAQISNTQTTIDVSIAAVNVAKAELRIVGSFSSYPGDMPRVSLLNATTVRMKRLNIDGAAIAQVEVTDWN